MMARLIAAVGLLALIAMAIAATRALPRVAPGVPRLPDRGQERLAAALAPIGPFAELAVGDNPFVPWQVRAAELAGPEGRDGDRDDAGRTVTDHRPLILPPARPIADQPRCVGVVRHAGSAALFVQQGDSVAALRPGEAVGGWRLVGVESGVASFVTPGGEVVGVGR